MSGRREQLARSWMRNGAAWTASVRAGRIDSRERVDAVQSAAYELARSMYRRWPEFGRVALVSRESRWAAADRAEPVLLRRDGHRQYRPPFRWLTAGSLA